MSCLGYSTGGEPHLLHFRSWIVMHVNGICILRSNSKVPLTCLMKEMQNPFDKPPSVVANMELILVYYCSHVLSPMPLNFHSFKLGEK